MKKQCYDVVFGVLFYDLGLTADEVMPERPTPKNKIGASAAHAQPVCIYGEAGRGPEEEDTVG
jgi:hypothetical protein